ncbi:MAG: signal peptidase I [Bacteroides sp.]
MKKGLKWIFALCGATVSVLLLRSFVFTSCLIPSEGMENSLFRGDHILVNKWSYGLRLPCMSLLSYHRWNSRGVKKEDIVLFNNPASTSQPVIDRREFFISRCVGVPGDTLFIDSLFSVLSADSEKNPDQKRLYYYPRAKATQLDSLLSILSIGHNPVMGQHDSDYVRSFSRYEYYLIEQAMSGSSWLKPVEPDVEKESKPLIVPGKGKVIRVYPWNRTLLRNTLVLHEGRQAEIKNDTLYVDGRPTLHCYFTKDYYWMSSNNSINLADSRLFGFVPQDHIIGKASLIWFSKEGNTGWFGGYRWKRFFRPIK